MSYMTQRQVVLPSALGGVFNYSGLSAVTFKGKLYLFWAGFAKDGVWCGVFDNKTQKWEGQFSCRALGATGMSIADYTTPSAVVYNDSLYVFFNGSGNDSTWWTSSIDGKTWAQVQPVSKSMNSYEGFASWTSPAVAVYQNKIHLVWNFSVPRNNPHLRHTYSTLNTDGSISFKYPQAVGANGLSIREQTSATMAVFQDKLCLFFNGSGQDGTWMTTLVEAPKWTDVVSVTFPLKGSALDVTSPAVFVSEDKAELTLIWNGSANDGIWYTKAQDGKTWMRQVSLAAVIGGQKLRNKVSPCGVNYGGIPYIFWVGSDGNLWCSQGLTFSVDNGNTNPALQALQAKNDFSIVTEDPNAVQFLKGIIAQSSSTESLSGTSSQTPGYRILKGDDESMKSMVSVLQQSQYLPRTAVISIISSILFGMTQQYTIGVSLSGVYFHSLRY